MSLPERYRRYCWALQVASPPPLREEVDRTRTARDSRSACAQLTYSICRLTPAPAHRAVPCGRLDWKSGRSGGTVRYGFLLCHRTPEMVVRTARCS